MRPFAVLALAFSLSVAGCTEISTAPATAAGTAAEPGGGAPPDAAGCPEGSPDLVMDGWTRTVAADGVALQRDGSGAELRYSREIDDALREGGVEENLWAELVTPRFSPRAQPVRTDDGGVMISGPVTEIATGTEVFAGLVSSPTNGVARPVVAFAADEASFHALFPSASALNKLHDLNAFSLSCASITGKWTTSSVSAAETYTATGVYTGLSVASDSLDLTFGADGTYQEETSAMVSGAFSRSSDQGTFTWGTNEIVLAGTKEQTTYDARLIAVQGGWALHIVNRQFTGMSYVLLRGR